MQTKTYQCLEPIRHNGKKYMPPATIELSDEEANRLLDCDAVVELDDGQLDLTPGTPSGESTAASDALAEQADKNTNQDPLNNKDGGDATLAAIEQGAASNQIPAEALTTPVESATGVDPAPVVTNGGEAPAETAPAKTGRKSKAK